MRSIKHSSSISIPVLSCTSTMANSKKCLSLARHLRPRIRLNGSKYSIGRGLATAAANPSTLPLAGIRVLDMTRVLAGVCVT